MQLVEPVSFKFPHIVRQDVKWTMCFVPLDIRVSSPIFASNCLKLNFKLFFLTDVSNYCEERKIKLSVNVYMKIARNLGSNFWNFGSNFLDFWQFFSNFLAFQWATFQHFTRTIGIGLLASLWRRHRMIYICISYRNYLIIQIPTWSNFEITALEHSSGLQR